ncbi:protein GAMETOPHYTE DEFECTIVE 1 isoform X2 [Eucalyptus grandis]|uniref:protein GAMETOPHYTE DEFECTIVE 1 isoform X2 n=1 Tax=Eucalyptus grandis TaxID=71139 RepID=UPI00192E9593|nr:protein GAMETOPHYTE DEFECTIVE 1 isoform X2 [Eucalyptus grandis]
MGFFDLNVPYDAASSPSGKADRVRIATKAMELGYDGVAYNRSMRGVMSERDRCSIPPLSLAALLKVAPSLSSSVSLHRGLLGLPLASAFRQYTRLTVLAETVAQAQVLNSGNPVLKTYDLVAVRPLNQAVFDHACEKSEVDIIAIDFSEKLPFRLKLPMVKTAIERGVYFEISYSSLISDPQMRRQVISTAKLLVDWTRGKNLIITSAASSVNEIRGPCDVANVLSLLGISMEQGKASISKNCRVLIANALKKKKFFKEAIRVEAMPSSERLGSEELWSGDLLKWDPLSSGDGDILLDDLKKSFSISNKVSGTVKAIDFNSIINSMSSEGFQVKDLTYGNKAAELSLDQSKTLQCASRVVSSFTRDNESLEPGKLDGLNILSKQNQSPLFGTSTLHRMPSNKVSEKPVLLSEAVDVAEDREEIGSIKALWHKNAVSEALVKDAGLQTPCCDDSKFVVSTPYIWDTILPASLNRGVPQGLDSCAVRNGDPLEKDQESQDSKSAEAFSGIHCATDEKTMESLDLRPREELCLVSDNLLSCEDVSGSRQVREHTDDATLCEEVMHSSKCDDSIELNDESESDESLEGVAVEPQTLEQGDAGISQPNLNLMSSDEGRTRRKLRYRSVAFPLKRLLSPVLFKKKARKHRRKF